MAVHAVCGAIHHGGAARGGRCIAKSVPFDSAQGRPVTISAAVAVATARTIAVWPIQAASFFGQLIHAGDPRTSGRRARIHGLGFGVVLLP